MTTSPGNAGRRLPALRRIKTVLEHFVETSIPEGQSGILAASVAAADLKELDTIIEEEVRAERDRNEGPPGRCTKCGLAELESIPQWHSVEVASHTLNVRVYAHTCRECHVQFVPLADMEHADLLAAAWLAEHGVQTREALRFMRKSLGLLAVDLARLFDVTPETVSRWERGTLPVERRAFALLGTLVRERVEGRVGTLSLLHTLRESPQTVPVASTRLVFVGAGGDTHSR